MSVFAERIPPVYWYTLGNDRYSVSKFVVDFCYGRSMSMLIFDAHLVLNSDVIFDVLLMRSLSMVVIDLSMLAVDVRGRCKPTASAKAQVARSLH